MGKKWSVVIAALFVVALGISLGIGLSFGNGQQPDRVSSDNVALILNTDKRVYDQGEKVLVTARVENHSSQSIHYLSLYFEQGEIDIRIGPVYGQVEEFDIQIGPVYEQGEEFDCLHKDGEISDCFRMNGSGSGDSTLAPGGSLVEETFWNQKLYSESGSELTGVGPGDYSIRVFFGLDDGQGFHWLEATLIIGIE